MNIVKRASPDFGVRESCKAIGLSRATYYRNLQESPVKKNPRKPHPRKLSEEEETAALNIMTSERFMDQSVPETFYTLLDEGHYLCSARTLYRILEKNKAVRERRNQLRHPEYQKPELLATGPNQVWSWDITKLKGPKKWSYYHLYVILDIYSRYVVGWMIAERESSYLAERLIQDTCEKEGVLPGQLTIHADRGSAMRSKVVAQLLADLGITKTHSRPHVSDDNPFSESQFKTLKYNPWFPKYFESMAEARSYLRNFFHWYNCQHKHSGIAWLTPETVHNEKEKSIQENRLKTLAKAYKKNPERFVRGEPKTKDLKHEVWINKPNEIAA